MYAQWCVQFSSTNRSRAWPLYTVLLYIVQFWGCKKHTDIKPYRLIRFFFLIFIATKVLYFFHGIGFIFFLTTMVLYVSQVKIRLRQQSVIGRVSHRTVCHSCVGSSLICNKPQHCFFLFAILLLYFVFAETYLSLDMFFLFLLRCRNKEQFTAAGCHSAVWHRRVDNSFFTVILCAVF